LTKTGKFVGLIEYRQKKLDGGWPDGRRDRGLPLEEDVTMAKELKPMHPGEVLREEFLLALRMSAGALAKACGLRRTRIERIASEQTGITADTALRLAKALGTTAQLWLNLQNDYDVQIAKRDLGKIVDRIETVNKPKAA
jgi:antitoxin HigA-1